MKKNAIKINEDQIRRMVAESVKRVLREGAGFPLDRSYNGMNYARDAREEGVEEISDWHDAQWNEIANILQNCVQKLDQIDPTDYGSWTDEVDGFIVRSSDYISAILTGIGKIVEDRDLDGLNEK